MSEAIKTGSRKQIIHTVKELSDIQPNGCWEWSKALRKGYPVYWYTLNGKRRSVAVHRLILETKQGFPLNGLIAHHKCSNSKCVSPNHLQATTVLENQAEMLQRQFYINRIAELEYALSEVVPDHTALRTAA